MLARFEEKEALQKYLELRDDPVAVQRLGNLGVQ